MKFFFAVIWLLLLVFFILYLHNGDGIFEKLEALGISDSLIIHNFYMMFGLFSFFMIGYTTYLTYKNELKNLLEIKEKKVSNKDKFKNLLEIKKKKVSNILNLLYSIMIFIFIGISFAIIQRNLLLSDIVSEKEQQNYIKSLEERIINLENKYR